jgi:hypothetical protein
MQLNILHHQGDCTLMANVLNYVMGAGKASATEA